ncbi:hypothetical protein KDJ21_007325 [Metabacillus litoralis]|uniref:hypothetical protein n=1 Tax=Metabacillus TaxID=2675233 RepID=UPI000EF56201|nr:hypothetical protein [Metabacillus litoralis]UHA61460.1 hypothetical protein KDJ21_007325 [Metabacillus litoralis]
MGLIFLLVILASLVAFYLLFGLLPNTRKWLNTYKVECHEELSLLEKEIQQITRVREDLERREKIQNQEFYELLEKEEQIEIKKEQIIKLEVEKEMLVKDLSKLRMEYKAKLEEGLSWNGF